MSWDQEEKSESGMTRRRWVKLGLATAAFAAGAAATGGGAWILNSFLPRPFPLAGTISESLVYTRFPTDQWWNSRDGTPVRVTDMGLWQGATAVWRGLFDENGARVPGTGYPVLVIRVPRTDTYYRLPNPSPWSLPPDASLYYDDPSRDLRIVVGLDRCTHLCCYPGWHVVTNPPPSRDYSSYVSTPPPTYAVYGQDPVYCICHGTQYDPLLLIQDTNPHNGVVFPGMELVHGPGVFAMPLVPVRTFEDVLEGVMADPRWYVYC